MTDISNYRPVRRLSPPVSSDNRKPYSRTGLKGILGTLDLNSGDIAVPTTPDSPYYPFHIETPRLEAPSQSRPNVPDGPRDIPGFPTHEQYQRIEDEYLSSLSERKQPKALISQSLFDKIYAVLQNGSEDRASTAQFRFWVRKMFVLAYPQTSFSHSTGQTPEPVVLHDKRPVAIKEHLYDVLCYCHAIARHGGRDKTCATLRLHYSWVPKELTAKFVKACPTCTLKRSGNPDLLSQFSQTAAPYMPPPVVSEHAMLGGGPNDTPPGLSFIGSSGCDGASFGTSIFTTPDLSVYPSPTLSAGSIGPTTPSPYLHSGLFGYPAMFDPGHNNLSSVAGWDPSPSPYIPAYFEELRAAGAAGGAKKPATADEIIDDACTRGLQLRLPTPNKSYFARIGGLLDPPPPGLESTPCTVNADANIDPALFMESYPPFGPMRTMDDADMDPIQRVDADAADVTEVRATTAGGGGSGGGGGGGGGRGPSYLLDLATTTWETPTASHSSRALRSSSSSSSSFNLNLALSHTPTSHHHHPHRMLSPSPSTPEPTTVFAPVPMHAPPALSLGMPSVLCSDHDMQDAGVEGERDDDNDGDSEQARAQCRWNSPEAWLVPSDSV